MDKLITSMKITLGTAFSLYLKAHGFHWNVYGPSFVSLHRLFGDIYKENWEAIDDIAEQIRQLDAYSPSTMERFIELSKIKGHNDTMPPTEMISMLLADIETMISVLTDTLHHAEQADKQGLVNFLAARIEAHSKQRWMLRATSKSVD